MKAPKGRAIRQANSRKHGSTLAVEASKYLPLPTCQSLDSSQSPRGTNRNIRKSFVASMSSKPTLDDELHLEKLSSDAQCQPSTAIELFLSAASDQSSALAVDGIEGPLSYADMAARVRIFATAIANRNARAKVLIALTPSGDAYAAILATLMAGGLYSPVNCAAPLAKQRLICARFDPDIVIAPRQLANELLDGGSRASILDPLDLAPYDGLPDEEPLHQPASATDCHPIAYVIFTSGSTGAPKGVEITRSALDHFVGWLGATLDIHSGDRFSQWANIAFDASLVEILGALCYGASLHPPHGHERIFPAELIRRSQLTHWISVPSVIGLMHRARQLTSENISSVRRFVFGGESLTASHVNDLFAVAPNAIVQNTYGPTEATVCVTTVTLAFSGTPELVTSSIPLGVPVPGMTIRLIGGSDEDEGEIVLIGPQLARGYLNDFGSTARAFQLIETNGIAERAYFTGDWARRNQGQLYFRGRIDSQMKHKGFRIEPGEIQAALVASGAREPIVFVSNSKLVAVAEKDTSTNVTVEDLRLSLLRLVESHAIPDEILLVAELPRNDNGKVDRRGTIDFYNKERVVQPKNTGDLPQTEPILATSEKENLL